MASELRVNTLKDASGNNSIGMSYVAEGSAKAWVSFNGTSTLSVGDSFNVSSVTDNGTGSYTANWSNSFGSADYASTSQSRMGSSQSAALTGIKDATDQSASACPVFTLTPSVGAADATRCNITANGDLA